MINFKRKIISILKAISILLIALLIVFKCTLMHVENKIINNYSSH